MDEVAVLWTPVFVSFAAAAVAAVEDFVEFRVRNLVTFPLIASGVVYHALFPGWGGFAGSLGGFLFGAAVLLAPWLLGLMGGGDVKLMAGIGAWLGLRGAIVAFAVTALATGLVAVALIVYRGKFRESLHMTKRIFYDLFLFRSLEGNEELLKDLSEGHQRRLRVIPFAALTPIGVVGAMVWMKWV